MGGSGARISLSGAPRSLARRASSSSYVLSREQLGQFVELEPEGHPRVSELEGAAQRPAGTASDPHLERPRQARGLDDEALEVVVRPVVRGDPVPPGGANGTDGIVGAVAPPVELVPEDLEFRLQRTHADTGDDTAAAQDVEGAQALHQLERVVIGQDRHVGQQADPRRLGGKETEGREGVEVAAAADGGRCGGNGDVLGAGHPVVAEPLRLLHHRHDVVDARRDLPLGWVEAGIHVQHRRHDADWERHARNVSGADSSCWRRVRPRGSAIQASSPSRASSSDSACDEGMNSARDVSRRCPGAGVDLVY